MEKQNKELLTRVFARTAQGDMRAMSEAMADDFRWVFPGSWSWSGTWEPKSVVVDELLRPLMTQLGGEYRLTADFVLADGDRVVVQAVGEGTTTAGQIYRQTYCFVFRVAGGQLTEVVEHCDTALVERVLTAAPRSAPKQSAESCPHTRDRRHGCRGNLSSRRDRNTGGYGAGQ